MAALLLSKLQSTIDDIVKIKEAGGTVDEGTDILVSLCTEIEDIFSYHLKTNTSFLQEDRGYWGYFCDCLESSSTIRLVTSMVHNTTYLGKGRAFIHQDLRRKTLAEHVQVACRNEKVTAQFYHQDAILRSPQLSTTLVDILYHLNDVKFNISNSMSLDESWPAFVVKSFATDPTTLKLNAESDTRSLMSTLSHDSDKSIEQLRVKARKLRIDCKELKKQRDAAIQDKDEADLAWNELVSKLKLQALNATEECEAAKENLDPFTRKVDELMGEVSHLKAQLEVAQDALLSLQPGQTAAKGVDLMSLAREIRSRFDAQLSEANNEKSEARAETEKLREELNSLRSEVAVQTAKSEKEKGDFESQIWEYRKREQDWERKKQEAVAVLRSSHEEVTKKLSTQVQLLQEQNESNVRALAELSSSLQDSERSREATVNHLTQLEESLVKERARSESSVSESNILRQALSKSTEEKQGLWQRIQNLSEMARVAQATVAATWAPDSAAKECIGCRSEFNFSNRRHHCRKCGQLYCDRCTSKTAMLSGSSKPQRICGQCDGLIRSLKKENFDVDNTSTYSTPVKPGQNS